MLIIVISLVFFGSFWGMVVYRGAGKKQSDSNSVTVPRPTGPRPSLLPLLPGAGAGSEDIERDNAEDKDRADMFSAKTSITERLSAVSPGTVQISGLENIKPWNTRVFEPYIRVEEYGNLKDASISINGREIVSPDFLVIERYTSPIEGTEYLLSAGVFWDRLQEEQKIPKYWLSEDVTAAKYAQGNPDGSVSLYVYLAEGSDDLLEMRTPPGAPDGELLSVSMNFRGADASKIKEIIGEIGGLCGLREPVRTGRWVWRKPGGIFDSDMKRLKSFIDGGLVKWHTVSEWNGYPVIDGSAVTWNGVLFSLQLIAGKERSEEILRVLDPLSEAGGFSINVEDGGSVVKILVTDNFVFNFSLLWGF
jgi:hypothetical protein